MSKLLTAYPSSLVGKLNLNPFYLCFLGLGIGIFSISLCRWAALLAQVVNGKSMAPANMLSVPISTAWVIISLLLLIKTTDLLLANPFFKQDLFSDLTSCLPSHFSFKQLYKAFVQKITESIPKWCYLKSPFSFFSAKGKPSSIDASSLPLESNIKELFSLAERKSSLFIITLIPLSILFAAILSAFVLTIFECIKKHNINFRDLSQKLFLLYIPSMWYIISVITPCAEGLTNIENQEPTISASCSILMTNSTIAAMGLIL